MIQAFYTAAAGMSAAQKNNDIITNNIANINTPGYRMRRAEFKALLSDYLQEDIKAGHGVEVAGVSYAPLPEGFNPYSLTVTEGHYFVLEDDFGNRYYTNKGDFGLMKVGDEYYLSGGRGYFVLDENGDRIKLPNRPDLFVIAENRLYPRGNTGEEGILPMVVTFADVGQLQRFDMNLFTSDDKGSEGAPSEYYRIGIYYPEDMGLFAATNNTAEITRLLQSQMAYQLNSRALQVADEIAGMTNRLRG